MKAPARGFGPSIACTIQGYWAWRAKAKIRKDADGNAYPLQFLSSCGQWPQQATSVDIVRTLPARVVHVTSSHRSFMCGVEFNHPLNLSQSGDYNPS